VDTQPFPINRIEPISKKVLVRPEIANIGKGKSIVIGDPCTSNISQGRIARKAPDKKTNKFGGARGQAQLSSQHEPLTRASRTVQHMRVDGPAHARGRSGAQIDGPGDSAGQSFHT
jgi:hypothetical protein